MPDAHNNTALSADLSVIAIAPSLHFVVSLRSVRNKSPNTSTRSVQRVVLLGCRLLRDASLAFQISSIGNYKFWMFDLLEENNYHTNHSLKNCCGAELSEMKVTGLVDDLLNLRRKRRGKEQGLPRICRAQILMTGQTGGSPKRNPQKLDAPSSAMPMLVSKSVFEALRISKKQKEQ